MSALKERADLALGNRVGSNIFNLRCVLGLSWVVSPSGISVSKAANSFDLPVTAATLLFITVRALAARKTAV